MGKNGNNIAFGEGVREARDVDVCGIFVLVVPGSFIGIPQDSVVKPLNFSNCTMAKLTTKMMFKILHMTAECVG